MTEAEHHASTHGMTLVEVLVAIGLMAAVAALFFPLLVSSTAAVRRLEAQSEAIDGLRVAVRSIGRELRSAACVAEPAAGSGAGPRLRFTTQANHQLYEVTYQVADGDLRRQVSGHGERIVAAGVLAAGGFETTTGSRTAVTVDFLTEASGDAAARRLTTTITARNAWRPC